MRKRCTLPKHGMYSSYSVNDLSVETSAFVRIVRIGNLAVAETETEVNRSKTLLSVMHTTIPPLQNDPFPSSLIISRPFCKSTMAGAVRQPIDVQSLERYISQNVPEIKVPIELKQVPAPPRQPVYHVLVVSD
jgi:hypothetical protein